MSCSDQWGKRWIFPYIMALFAVSTLPVLSFAASARQRANEEVNARQEQVRQEAQRSAAEISRTLTQILQLVNQNRHPESDLIEQIASMLVDDRRYATSYDDSQKALYMLLQAWVYFYQDNPNGAMNWAMRSCKTDQTNGDAWISQALFCQLNGKRPMEPRIPRTNINTRQNTINRRQPGRVNQSTNNENYVSQTEPYGRKGTLSFDLSALRSDVLREHLSRLDLQTAEGGKLTYKPGENTLSMLVWQAESIGDANDIAPPQPAYPRGRNMMNDRNMRNELNSQVPQKLTLESQQTYFNNLFAICKKSPQITILQMNMNDAQTARQIKTESEGAAPLVFASNPSSGARAFMKTEAQVPFMLIADKEGNIRYAGPAADFMPAFILTHLTGVEIPLNASGQIDIQTRNTAAQVRGNGSSGQPTTREMLLRRGMNQNTPVQNRRVFDPNHLIDPNMLTVDPNTLVSTPVTRPTRPTKPVEMSLEDQVKADRLMELAREQIESSRIIRGKSPKQGIDACKQILENYPGTEYAERAREQLRRVPSRYWEEYDIADLLGY